MDTSELIQSMFRECQPLTLLYVEDDHELAKNTYEMLNPFFKSMTVAADGKEGLHAYEASDYDIVLTDILMPNMNGREMSRLIRQINPNQAIIVMSAHEDSNYFMELIEIGISKFVQKPPSLQQLFGSIVPTAININNAKKVAMYSNEMKQNLAESKELLRNIIDTVPVRIFWKDKESHYLGCNALFAQDAGVKSQVNLIGKTDFDLPWKNEAQGYIDDDRQVMESGIGKINIEEQQTQSDDKCIWLSTSKVPLKNEKGEIFGVLGAYIDTTEHNETMLAIQKAKNDLSYQAQHDALTGLPNRLLYFDRLRQAIKKVTRTNEKLAVIFVDLDRFKEINDSLGHDIGDKIVQLLGTRLKSQFREVDTIARFGGDEFTILIESVKDVADVGEIVQKMIRSMEDPFDVDDHRLYLTLSAGISIYPDDAHEPEDLIRNADTAMYRAKEEGRNAYQFYMQEMTEKTLMHMMMTKNIHNGIKNQEFVVYYQPQINATTRKIVGMEALVRWQSPTDGLISPAVFIPIAEEAGLIDKIGELVFNKAASQIAAWYDMGFDPGRVAINLSAIELQKDNFIEVLQERLIASKCKNEWIELEITEGYTMKHPVEAIKMLQKISDLGIHLSIDDFGTGYSSLSYLKKLPIHKLKIDQSFVRDIPKNKNDAAIVLSIIFLAKTMKFDVIAEGVETNEQQNYLVSKGCHNIQGYLNGKPMPSEQMEEFLRTFQ